MSLTILKISNQNNSRRSRFHWGKGILVIISWWTSRLNWTSGLVRCFVKKSSYLLFVEYEVQTLLAVEIKFAIW